MPEYNLLSLNVRGLRNKEKRSQIFEWLKRCNNGTNCFVFLQETHSSKVDEDTWQKEWGSKIIFGHGSTNSRGVAIMFPMHFNFDIIQIVTDIDGRKLCVELSENDESFALLNVYAPTQNNTEEHIKLVESLRNELELFSEKLIIGGDMNLYLDPNLDKDRPQHHVCKAASELKNVLNDYEYVDIWRILNPGTKKYTWCRKKPIVQSRLDYWFVPREMIYNISSCSIKPAIKTDHRLISLTFIVGVPDKRGPGLWKFNSSLLHNPEYVTGVKEVLRTHDEIENKSLKWEIIKMKIRQFSISFSKKSAKEKREEEIKLSSELEISSAEFDKNPTDDNFSKFEQAKIRMEQINEIKTNGAIIRSRAQWVEQGEKNTKYFLNVEKRNYKAKHITKLKIEHDKYTTDPKDILLQQKIFYENLYSESKVNNTFDSIFLNELPTLSNENVSLTESELSIEELTLAIKSMKCGKSPGSDGLSTEFYKFFWSDIRTFVLDSLTTAYEMQLMSQEQRRAVLRLIPKKDKDIMDLKNWRPISLLNTDYKILAHTMANRLQKVIPKIISKDQNAYIKGRFIGYNIRTILDVIETSSTEKLKSIIAFLDFEKAFDKLSWSFINKCLDAFGFGMIIKRWVRIMYTDISSCVINNGFTTQYFNLGCGIRQGCPLSALLFIIAAETLAISIRNNSNIKGVDINGLEVKLCQLADDTTLFLKDIRSLQITLNILFMFHKSSGLKLNSTKTEILSIGHTYGYEGNPFNLKWVKERVYALGTWFYKDVNLCTSINYEERFLSFQSTLKSWKMRHLSLYGKITIIKTLALSKLNYCIMTLPTPQWLVKAVQEEINCFLWSNKPPRIKYKTAVACHENGGLKLTDMDSFVKSQKAIWVKRLQDTEQPASRYLQQFLKNITLSDLLICSMDPEEIPFEFPAFYRQVLHAWFTVKLMSENKFEDIVIWNNKNIKIQGQTVFYKRWYKKGVFYLKDLFKRTGNMLKILTVDEFKSKYDIECQNMHYMSLIDAIPKSWRKAKRIQMDEFQGHRNIIFGIDLCKIESKKLYSKFLSVIEQEATCITNWSKKYQIKFTAEQWKFIFLLPKTLTYSTKLQELQLKITHRIYATDSYVNNFDKTVDISCKVCNVKNNIMHWFAECTMLKLFWKLFEKWLQKNIFPQFQLDPVIVIFGFLNKNVFIVNYCLLQAKQYIHYRRTRCSDNTKLYFSFTCFLQLLKQAVIVEKQIATNRTSLPEYEKKINALEQSF